LLRLELAGMKQTVAAVPAIDFLLLLQGDDYGEAKSPHSLYRQFRP